MTQSDNINMLYLESNMSYHTDVNSNCGITMTLSWCIDIDSCFAILTHYQQISKRIITLCFNEVPSTGTGIPGFTRKKHDCS